MTIRLRRQIEIREKPEVFIASYLLLRFHYEHPSFNPIKKDLLRVDYELADLFPSRIVGTLHRPTSLYFSAFSDLRPTPAIGETEDAPSKKH